MKASLPPSPFETVDVGAQLRRLRQQRGYSIRLLAERSGLNVNTLSLIENGKTSPSVSTLQQVALALGVPITAFFAGASPTRPVVFQKANERSIGAFAGGRANRRGHLADLGAGFSSPVVVPFILSLDGKSDSGKQAIVHTGVELVFCLSGQLEYQVGEAHYLLEPGDSLLFEAHLPHRWRTLGEQPVEALLVLAPTDERDRSHEQHLIER